MEFMLSFLPFGLIIGVIIMGIYKTKYTDNNGQDVTDNNENTVVIVKEKSGCGCGTIFTIALAVLIALVIFSFLWLK